MTVLSPDSTNRVVAVAVMHRACSKGSSILPMIQRLSPTEKSSLIENKLQTALPLISPWYFLSDKLNDLEQPFLKNQLYLHDVRNRKGE